MERNIHDEPCPCPDGKLGWKWKYQCHLCNDLLCDECFTRCSAGCGQLLCAKHTWFCVHCETRSCFQCSTCYVTSEIPRQAEDYYCDMCLSRAEAEALSGSGWRRQCKDITLMGNSAIYVTHRKVSVRQESSLSEEWLSSEDS